MKTHSDEPIDPIHAGHSRPIYVRVGVLVKLLVFGVATEAFPEVFSTLILERRMVDRVLHAWVLQLRFTRREGEGTVLFVFVRV